MSTRSMKVVTERINPPIPLRHMDWRATFEGYEPGEPMGFGASEQEAIASLHEEQTEFDEWQRDREENAQ